MAELSEAGHRLPEFNLKREVAWYQRVPFSYDPTLARLYTVGKAPICEPIRGLSATGGYPETGLEEINVEVLEADFSVPIP